MHFLTCLRGHVSLYIALRNLKKCNLRSTTLAFPCFHMQCHTISTLLPSYSFINRFTKNRNICFAMGTDSGSWTERVENHSLNRCLSSFFKCILPNSLDVYADFQNDYVSQLLYPLTMKNIIMEYYSATKRNKIGSFVVMWMNLDSVIQCEVSQKE